MAGSVISGVGYASLGLNFAFLETFGNTYCPKLVATEQTALDLPNSII